MSIKIIGSNLCPDTVAALDQFSDSGREVEFVNITESLSSLKEYLNYRDNSPLYKDIKENGSVGIPLFIYDNDKLTFEIKDVL